MAERLETVAEVEGRSVSDVVREAIAALVEARQQDERFIRLLEDNVARHQRLLQMLRDEKWMTPIDLGALVVIAARALEEDVPAALDLLDVAAAEAALAEAALAEADPAGTPPRPARPPCSARSSGIARWPGVTSRSPCSRR